MFDCSTYLLLSFYFCESCGEGNMDGSQDGSSHKGLMTSSTTPDEETSSDATNDAKSNQTISPLACNASAAGLLGNRRKKCSDRDRPCLVCGDRGTGSHYSAFSCDGCKSFFKRTLQKKISYSCRGPSNLEGRCEINKASRNSCQFCRFQKCLDVGMKPDAVRVSRMSDGNLSNKRSQSDSQPSQSSRPRSPPDVCQISSEAAAAVGSSPTEVSFYSNLNEEEAEPWQLTVRALIDASPQTYPYDTTDPDCESDIPSTSDGTLPPPSVVPAGSTTNEDLAKGGNHELLMIIQWAKAVPGFRQLCLEDQMSLLKASFMDLMILRVAYRSMDSYPLIRATGKHVLTAAECKQLGWGDLSDGTLAFNITLQTMKLDLPEFCIMNALVLCFPDAPGLVEIDSVRALQRRFLECLQKHDRDAYPKEPKRYGKLLLRLPTLRKVSNTAMDHLLRMRISGRVEVTSLVDELTNCTI